MCQGRAVRMRRRRAVSVRQGSATPRSRAALLVSSKLERLACCNYCKLFLHLYLA